MELTPETDIDQHIIIDQYGRNIDGCTSDSDQYGSSLARMAEGYGNEEKKASTEPYAGAEG